MTRRIGTWLALAALGFASAACGKAGADGDGEETGEACDGVVPDFTPLRRITRDQFENTVRDLFGPDIDPGSDFPLSSTAGIYTVTADANIVTEFGAQALFDAAEHVAGQVTNDWVDHLACEPTAVDATCVQTTVEALGARVFRRPLLAEERDTLTQLWTNADPAWSEQERFGLVVFAMLQSPQFLYLAQGGGTPVEATASDGSPLTRISDYEMASRLSYLLWETTPDAELTAAAAAGELHEPEQIEAQVRRLLADPRASAAIARFHREWLGISNVENTQKNETIYQQFDPELAASMAEQTRRFVDDIVLQSDGSLTDLLTSRSTEVNGRLAALYEVDAPGLGLDDWAEVQMPDARPGLLTQASLLATYAHEIATSPVLRGRFVNSRLMCVKLAPPPPNVDTSLPTPEPGATQRDVLEVHRENEYCAECHDYIDPPGLAFENFDAIGAYRTLDNGSPIDPSGTLLDGDGNAVADFADAAGLVNVLATNEMVPRCYVENWVYYAHGETPRDPQSCYVQSLGEAFIAGEQNIQDLVVALTTSDAFRYRRDPQSEN